MEFSEDEVTEVTDIAWRYLLSGFILESNAGNYLNEKLANNLKDQRKVQLMKYLAAKHDLSEIATAFKENNIDFVVMKGMALTIGGIYKPSVRGSRDIDILVDKQEIGSAYKALRSIGFRYENPKTLDNANFLYGHHLPAMRNTQGTLVELHWQVSNTFNIPHCPLTKAIINNKRELNQCPNIFIPDISAMMVHSLYHGLVSHRLGQGPIFLFDLLALYEANNKKWPDNKKLLIELNLLEDFSSCKSLIEAIIGQKPSFNDFKELSKDIMGGFDWPTDARFSIFGISEKRTLMSFLLVRTVQRLNTVSNNYQISKKSFKFWILLLNNLYVTCKKFKL